jgi:carboxymethylenebutenolidase
VTTPLTVRQPEADPKGGIVVVQEAFGVNAYIESVCDGLAADGWLAVAPHLFHRSGNPTIEYEAGIAEAFKHMRRLTADGVLADVDAAVERIAAAGVPASRIGITGFCMGGTVALVTAARRDVGAAVSWYGGGVTEGRFGFDPLVEEATRLRAPWLGLYGDMDTGIPVDQVEELRTAAAASGQPTELVRYAEAGHGFHCHERDVFHEPSATDGWSRMLGWFGRYLR